MTDPIVGTGVNTISTGTPFVNPLLFQPYDPESVLGVPQEILLTPLASKRVIDAVAQKLGWKLDAGQLTNSLEWVKSEAFDRGVGVIDRDDFVHFLQRSYS